MRIGLVMRWSPLVLLGVYLLARLNSEPTILTELLLYNLVAFACIGTIRADYVGKNLPTSSDERVSVLLAESDSADQVLIEGRQ